MTTIPQTAPAAPGHGRPGDVLSAVRQADETIRRNRLLFDRAVAVAVARARAGRHTSAAQWARTAAHFAMTNATGELRSVALERAIDIIAEGALPRSTRPSAAADGRRRVLHVLSEAAAIGGLTRLAERWIGHDARRVSSVVVTRQHTVAASLAQAARATGGTAVALGTGDAVASAGVLRRMGEQADVVVCHLQPDDPIPAIAFGAGYRGAPVAVFDHADHLFLLAPTHAAAIVDFRAIGSALSTEARGYAPGAALRLPLLVPDDGTDGPRADLDAPGAVVAITVARPVKFQDTSLEPRFADILSQALERHPQLVVCAVGPHPEDAPWPELERRHPGRLRIVGPVSDPRPYLRSADLYIDTFPFSSLTSLLEASALSLPVLTLDAHGGFRKAFGVADFVADEADRPEDLDAFHRRLDRLVHDPAARHGGGERARGVFERMAPAGRWAADVEELYRDVAESAVSPAVLGDAPAPRPDGRMAHYARGVLAIEQRVPLLWTVIGYLGGFDPRDRRSLRLRVLLVRALDRIARLRGRAAGGTEPLLVPRAGRHGTEDGR